MNGPYETELEAIKAARIWETQGQTMLSASLTMLIEACSTLGSGGGPTTPSPWSGWLATTSHRGARWSPG